MPGINPPQRPAGLPKPLLNATLRGGTLVSRLALLFFLARMLVPAELGLYGLFVVTVTFSMLAVGLDFYTYSQREILSRPRPERAGILLHHAGLTGLAYLVVLPLSMLVFAGGHLPWWTAPWFAALLIAEHTAQEVNRLLIAVQRQVAAGVVLFVRQGLWVWLMLGIMWFAPGTRGLGLVFIFWLGGCLAAILMGLLILRREIERPSRLDWDWGWIRRGIRTGLVFLAATLCLRGILTFDRYLFEDMAGLDLLGVYTLYAGLALALMNFIDASVFVFRYPPMVRAYQHRDYTAYSREWRLLMHHAGIAVMIAAIPAAILGPLVGELVGKPLYHENVAIFWWLLTAASLQALGMIPHYGLYAMRRDRAIFLAHATGLTVFLLLALLLGGVWPTLGVPAAVAMAFGWIGLFKLTAYRRARRQGPPAPHTTAEDTV